MVEAGLSLKNIPCSMHYNLSSAHKGIHAVGITASNRTGYMKLRRSRLAIE